MAINLTKGQAINLDKQRSDLSLVTIGVGWDVRARPLGFLGRFFGAKDSEYDLDIIAIALQNGRLVNIGDERLQDSDVVFYNNMSALDGQLQLDHDDRTGGSNAGGDDEKIFVRLADIAKPYDRIVFVVQIYDGKARVQDFSQVANAYVRAVDGAGKELARYTLTGAHGMRSVIFAELRRAGLTWDFRALGDFYAQDSFTAFLEDYMEGRR